TRPHKSGSHDASKGSEYSVNVLPLDEKFRVADWRVLVTDGLVPTVGKKSARFCFTTARAARKLANAAATVWFETFTCTSSAFRFVSPSVCHQLPRIASSFGSAVFQPSLNASG